MAKAKKGESKRMEAASPVAQDEEWRGKDDAEQLMRAHEIMMDPSRFKRAHGHIRNKEKAIRSIKDIKRSYDEKYNGGMNAMNDDDSEMSSMPPRKMMKVDKKAKAK